MSNKRVLSFSVCADGSLLVDSRKGHALRVEYLDGGGLRILTEPSKIMPSGNQNRADKFTANAKIGQLLDDGTIYAGISPTNGQPFCISSEEHIKRRSRNKITECYSTKKFHGYDDWQVSSPEELAFLYKNQTKGAIKKALGQWQRKHYFALNEDGRLIVVDPKGQISYGLGSQLYSIPVRYPK